MIYIERKGEGCCFNNVIEQKTTFRASQPIVESIWSVSKERCVMMMTSFLSSIRQLTTSKNIARIQREKKEKKRESETSLNRCLHFQKLWLNQRPVKGVVIEQLFFSVIKEKETYFLGGFCSTKQAIKERTKGRILTLFSPLRTLCFHIQTKTNYFSLSLKKQRREGLSFLCVFFHVTPVAHESWP